MSLLSRIFDFIKGLVTRPGLHTFLQKYQSEAVKLIEQLAHVNSGKGFNDWWDQAFSEMKAMVTSDGKSISDNWVAIVLNLAFEVYKAEVAGHNDAPPAVAEQPTAPLPDAQP